jgi:hypothetical protein
LKEAQTAPEQVDGVACARWRRPRPRCVRTRPWSNRPS